MKHIEINIGKACNNKCQFCMSSLSYVNEQDALLIDKKEIDLTPYKKIEVELIKYAGKGYTSVGFLGGDISIHPNIYQILARSKELEFKKINIITNAMVFSDFGKAQKIVSSGANRINISIHSHKDIIEDNLTGIPGGLERKILAIDNFNILYKDGSLQNPLSFNLVINGYNYDSLLESILYFYEKKGIRDFRLNFIWLRFILDSGIIASGKEKLSVSFAQFLPYLKKIIYISLKYNIRITFDSIPACIFHKAFPESGNAMVKRFLGETNDHIEEVVNINKNQVFDWKEQKKDELKQKFNECDKCIYKVGCQGVWKEYIQIYGDKEFVGIVENLV